MAKLTWILLGGILMSGLSLVGSLTIVLSAGALERILLPLVSLAAGSLLGGAFFHMIPHASAAMPPVGAAVYILAGFTAFLALEQLLHWHHCHRESAGCRRPVTYLILLGDALHNFMGGLGVASIFMVDPRAGVIAWLAEAAHEIPQELGDFGILVHGGWSWGRALAANLASGLTFLVGAVLAYVLSLRADVSALALFAAGNFIYIGASDLIPEIKASPRLGHAGLHLGCFVAGVLAMLALAQIEP